MELSLKGKKAFVCGGSKGIGKAIAVELAKLGASICLLARSEKALQSVKSSLSQTQGQIHDYIVADFSNPEALMKTINTYLNEKPEANILINNSGGPSPGPLLEADTVALRKGFEMHVICSQLLTQRLVPFMKKGGYGRIINVISTSVKEPIPGLGVSNTIRGAMGNWSKTLSLELAPFGITVNNILPGFTDTERLQSLFQNKADQSGVSYETIRKQMIETVPMKRLADAQETAAAVAFLASPSAAYITGINLPVDGGRTASL